MLPDAFIDRQLLEHCFPCQRTRLLLRSSIKLQQSLAILQPRHHLIELRHLLVRQIIMYADPLHHLLTIPIEELASLPERYPFIIRLARKLIGRMLISRLGTPLLKTYE